MHQIEIFNKSSLFLLKKYNVLRSLINQMLLDEKISSINLTTEEKQQIKDIFINKNQIKSEDEFERFLDNQNLNKNVFYDKAGKQLKIDKYCLENHSHQVGARFLERKNELDQVIYSLIRVKDVFTAKELFLRIKEGANFGDIAKEFSEGPENKTRGIVGPVSLNSSTPALLHQLRSSKPNKTNAPLQVSEWWLITRLESLTEATLDKTIELIMAREIMQKSIEEETEEIINSLELNESQNAINSENK